MTHQTWALNESIIHSCTYFQFQPIFPSYMKYIGSLKVLLRSRRKVIATFNSDLSNYVIERSFSLTLITNDMKRIYKKVFKSKIPPLGSIHGPGPATSTSTLITSTTDLMPSIPASDATASVQVTAGVTVSVQLHQSHL